jgi:hypothetical protein
VDARISPARNVVISGMRTNLLAFAFCVAKKIVVDKCSGLVTIDDVTNAQPTRSTNMTQQDTIQLTIAEIIDQARREDLSNKKIRSLLFHAGFDHKVEFPAIRDALGREAGDDGAANLAVKQQAADEAAARRAERAAADQLGRESREQAEREAREKAAADRQLAKESIADGCIIWCDAAQNTVVKVVNSYGRQAKFDNGGYRVGLVAETSAGDYVARHANTKCPDQFAGECYAVLKAVELAVEAGLQSCVIRNDRIGGFDASTKRGYIGAKYLWIAKQMSEEQGLAVTFEPCSGSENRADRASRTVG